MGQLRVILIMMTMFLALGTWAQEAPVDTVSTEAVDSVMHMGKVQQFKQRVKQRIEEKKNEPYDTIRDKGYWWRALKHGKVDLDGGTIDYPAFIDFCWKVYKWGDKAFNSYDTAYVVSTGKNWKLMLKSMNWADTYAGEPVKNSHIFTRSNLTSNLGLQLSFMAVSVGYTMGLSDWIHGDTHSKKLDFSFTCARFSADAYFMENTGKTVFMYRQSGGEKYKGTIRDFGGMKRKFYGMSAFYFLNNRRYAQAAAYCFSKYQKRSAGSFIVGICLQHRDMSFDASEFPQVVRDNLPENVEMPHFLYNDYCLMFGYGHNWVLGKRWLLNLTVTPYTGYRHMIATQHEERASRWSINLRARMAAVYNLNRFFLGMQSYTDIHHYTTDNYFFTGSILDFTVLAGIRF